MNNMQKTKQNEHFENCMKIEKVVSLLKTLPCEDVEDLASINATRKILALLHDQEYDLDMKERTA